MNIENIEVSEETVSKPALPLWARIILIIISFIILTGIFQFIGLLIAGISPDSLNSLTVPEQLLLSVFNIVSLIIVIYVFRKHIDRKSFKSMGFQIKNRLVDMAMGFLAALFVICLGSFILVISNAINLTYVQFDFQTLLLSFLLFFLVAIHEEVFFRGYILNNLMTSMNKYFALLISSVIFALFHALNFNLSLWSIINLVIAGILLGSSYIFNKNLWFPISLHWFWNFFQGPVLGYSVSGSPVTSIFKESYLSPDIINGGAFGFEGSVICTFLSSVAIMSIFWYFLRNQQQLE